RVVTALEAHDASDAIGQQIDDLSLAFVAPLGADDDNILAHGELTQLRADDNQKHPTHHHADETADSQLPVRGLNERHHDAFHERRIEKRHDALDDEIQGERREQIGPLHDVRPIYRDVERLRYLKNSLSGEITS